MTPAVETPRKTALPWGPITFFGAVLVIGYFPVPRHLIRQCYYNEDMGHAFFVPVVSAFIIWQNREELMAIKTQPDWRGLLLVIWSGIQLTIATLGTELFTSRVAFVFAIIGV